MSARRTVIVVLAVAWCFASTAHCDDAEGVARKIQQRLRDWDTYEKEWETKADIVVVAGYISGTYPCIFFEDGSSGMPSRSTFTIEETKKGKINRHDFDVNLAGLDEQRFPWDVVAGRKYLVFLKPSKKSKLILDDPEKHFSSFTQMGAEELVAIIDISKSKEEAESEKIVAHKKGQHGDFTFTPDKWKELRNSKTIDLAAQKSFIPFLVNVVLEDNATIARVRSYLGKPDYRHMNADGTHYRYSLNTAAPTPHGTVSGRIELSFEQPGTKLREYRIPFYEHIEERSEAEGDTTSSIYIRELDARELREAGLPVVERREPEHQPQAKQRRSATGCKSAARR